MSNIVFSPEALSALQKFAGNIEQPQSINNQYAYDQAFCQWCKKNPVFSCKLIKFNSNEKPVAKVTRMPFKTERNGAETIAEIVSATPERLQMFGSAEIEIPEFNSGKSVNLKMSVATAAAIYGAESATLKATTGEITIGTRKNELWVSVSSSETPNWEKFLLAAGTPKSDIKAVMAAMSKNQ
jgi:hypothetical protein